MNNTKNPSLATTGRHTTINRRVAIIAASAAALVGIGMSNPVQAALIPVACPILIGPNPVDVVKIEAVGADFGSGGMDGNVPAGCGTLTWDLGGSSSFEITPKLAGHLYLKNSTGLTARMRLEYRDVDGTLLGSQNGSPHTALDNDEDFTINLGSRPDAYVYQVNSIIQTQNPQTLVWSNLASDIDYLGSSTKAPDNVTVAAVGYDFGTGGLVNNAPAGPGTVTWDLSANTIAPRLQGNLYVKNGLNVPVRVRVTYLNIWGRPLTSIQSTGEHVPNTNGLDTTPINFAAPFPLPEIYSVDVQIEIEVAGTWQAKGPKVTVSL